MSSDLTAGALSTVTRIGPRWIDEPSDKLRARLDQGLADARAAAGRVDVRVRMALDTWNFVNVNAWAFAIHNKNVAVVCNRGHPADQITFIASETPPAPNDRRCGTPSEVPPLR